MPGWNFWFPWFQWFWWFPWFPEALLFQRSRLPCYCWNKVVFLQMGSEKTPLVPGSRVAVAKTLHEVPLGGIQSRVKLQKWWSLRLSNCPIYNLLCQKRNPHKLEVSMLDCASTFCFALRCRTVGPFWSSSLDPSLAWQLARPWGCQRWTGWIAASATLLGPRHRSTSGIPKHPALVPAIGRGKLLFRIVPVNLPFNRNYHALSWKINCTCSHSG